MPFLGHLRFRIFYFRETDNSDVVVETFVKRYYMLSYLIPLPMTHEDNYGQTQHTKFHFTSICVVYVGIVTKTFLIFVVA